MFVLSYNMEVIIKAIHYYSFNYLHYKIAETLCQNPVLNDTDGHYGPKVTKQLSCILTSQDGTIGTNSFKTTIDPTLRLWSEKLYKGQHIDFLTVIDLSSMKTNALSLGRWEKVVGRVGTESEMTPISTIQNHF